MKLRISDWYKRCWSLDIKNQSWTEDTERQVEFIIQTLQLTGRERILDLACGYGRHALSFARRGYSVVGVDITPAFIADAQENAAKEQLPAVFLCADIRDVTYKNEFDVVLNLADGAIGYLESDAENMKIFDVIARALKPGGQHWMDIGNAEHAEQHFPKQAWELGANSLALSHFEWVPEARRMLYAGWDMSYGEIAQRPQLDLDGEGDGIRLYSRAELDPIFAARQMQIIATYSDYNGKPETPHELQLIVHAKKQGKA